MKKKISNNLILILLFTFITGLRIWLAHHMNYIAVYSPYDDSLAVELGLHLSDGDWLGAYGLTTLIKGSVYPIFLSISATLGIPYSVLLTLLMALAGVCLVWAVADICKNRIMLLVAYSFALFHPVSYAGEFGRRIYRTGIYPWFLLILFTCLLKLYTRRRSFRQMLPPLIIFSIVYTLTLHTREDGIWLLPLTIVGLCVCAGSYLLYELSNRHGKTGICLRSLIIHTLLLVISPFLLNAITTSGLKLINYAHYGVFLENDRTSGNFADLMSLMYKAKPRDEIAIPTEENIWFTHDTLQMCMEASPSLMQLSDEITCTMDAYGFTSETDGIKSDFLQWVIREAFARAGYFDNPQLFQDKCEEICNELRAAYSDGRLLEDDLLHISAQSRGIEISEALPFMQDAAVYLIESSKLGGCFMSYPIYSKAPEEIRAEYEKVTRMNFSPEWIDSPKVSLTEAFFKKALNFYKGFNGLFLFAGAIGLLLMIYDLAKRRDTILLPLFGISLSMILYVSKAMLLFNVSESTYALDYQSSGIFALYMLVPLLWARLFKAIFYRTNN